MKILPVFGDRDVTISAHAQADALRGVFGNMKYRLQDVIRALKSLEAVSVEIREREERGDPISDHVRRLGWEADCIVPIAIAALEAVLLQAEVFQDSSSTKRDNAAYLAQLNRCGAKEVRDGQPGS